MTPEGETEPMDMREAWPDAEPPANLDRAVRSQAAVLLAGRRAAREAQHAGAYPAWLLALTAALLGCAALGARTAPAAQGFWLTTRQALDAAPLARLWLAALGSNLLAAILAPALMAWRKAHGS